MCESWEGETETYRNEISAFTGTLEVSFRVFLDILSEGRANMSSIVTLVVLSEWRTPGAGVVTTCGMLDFDDFCSA